VTSPPAPSNSAEAQKRNGQQGPANAGAVSKDKQPQDSSSDEKKSPPAMDPGRDEIKVPDDDNVVTGVELPGSQRPQGAVNATGKTDAGKNIGDRKEEYIRKPLESSNCKGHTFPLKKTKVERSDSITYSTQVSLLFARYFRAPSI